MRSRYFAFVIAILLIPAAAAPRAGGAGEDGRALLAEARFVDACLRDLAAAEEKYQKALSAGGLLPVEEAEAEFGIARCRILRGREAAGTALLERLAERIGDGAIRPWPARARRALDRMALRDPPFERPAPGEGVFTVAATAEPLVDLLRRLLPETGVSVAFDETVRPDFLVTMQVEDVPFSDLMDGLVGKTRWRRVGEGMAVGAIAADGEAFERPFRYEDLRDPREREVAGILRTRRISLTCPGTPLPLAVDTLRKVAGAPIEVEPRVLEGRTRIVRVFAKSLPADDALDLLAAPVGLIWKIEGGKVVLRERRGRAAGQDR